MKSVLTLVSSKNPPVFSTPMIVEHLDDPKVDDPFFFVTPHYGKCWLSNVQSIAHDSKIPLKRITTLNSVYLLQEIATELFRG